MSSRRVFVEGEPEPPIELGRRTIEVAVLAERVRAHRRLILGLVTVATVVTAIVAFLLPPVYRSEATILPPTEEASGLGIASLLRGIGVPGVKVSSQVAPSDVFLAVVQSRRVGEEIVRRFDLRSRYKKKFMIDALKELRQRSHFELTQAGLIVIAVEDHDPRMAAAMTTAYVDLLDQVNRQVRMTKGKRTRLFLEQRLAETRDSLLVSERRLAEYQSRTKTLALSQAASTALEAAAALYAQRAALQVRLGVIRSYSNGITDDMLQSEQRMVQLDQQLRSLPVIGLEMVRLLRDAKTYEQLSFLLTGQYEEARIEETRDVATVEVLDPAGVPERKAKPKRILLILSAFTMSLAAGVVYALLAPPPVPSRDGGS